MTDRLSPAGLLKRLVALGCILSMPACAFIDGNDDDGPITIGSVTFAENQIVAEMYAQVLEASDHEVERRFNFQNREELQPDMRSGAIDLAPEYIASLLTSLDSEASPSANPRENLDELRPLLENDGLELLTPSRANNTNAIVVDGATAGRYGLAEVSDLEAVSERLVFGGPPECPDRRFCLEGLRDVYGLSFKSFRRLDPGGPLTIAALSSGQIDVALLFSTSPVIAERGWVALLDDRNLQAAENITPLIRSEASTEEVVDLLNSVSATLTTTQMTELNARVEIENEDFRDVARDFLDSQDLL